MNRLLSIQLDDNYDSTSMSLNTKPVNQIAYEEFNETKLGVSLHTISNSINQKNNVNTNNDSFNMDSDLEYNIEEVTWCFRDEHRRIVNSITKRPVKEQVYSILHNHTQFTRLKQLILAIFQVWLFSTILLCILISNIETTLILSDPTYINTIVYYLNLYCFITFTIELLLYFYSTPIRQLFNLLMLIDILSYISYILDIYHSYFISNYMVIYLNLFQFLRVFRILKITRYSYSLGLVYHVLKSHVITIFLFFVLFLVCCFFFGNLIYFIDTLYGRYNNTSRTWMVANTTTALPYQNILYACWFCATTMSTVGYGVYIPYSRISKFFTLCLQCISILFLSYPHTVLSKDMQYTFNKYHRNNARRWLQKNIKNIIYAQLFIKALKELENKCHSEDKAQEHSTQHKLEIDITTTFTSNKVKIRRNYAFLIKHSDSKKIKKNVYQPITRGNISLWSHNSIHAITVLQRLLEGYSGVATLNELVEIWTPNGKVKQTLAVILYCLFDAKFVEIFCFKEFTTRMLVSLTAWSVHFLLLFPEEKKVKCSRNFKEATELWSYHTSTQVSYTVLPLKYKYNRWYISQKCLDLVQVPSLTSSITEFNLSGIKIDPLSDITQPDKIDPNSPNPTKSIKDVNKDLIHHKSNKTNHIFQLSDAKSQLKHRLSIHG